MPYRPLPKSYLLSISKLYNPICAKPETYYLRSRSRASDRRFTVLLYYYFNKGRHFGRPVQPYYIESLAWLKDDIEGHRVNHELLRRDQYERVVALPLLHAPSTALAPLSLVVDTARRQRGCHTRSPSQDDPRRVSAEDSQKGAKYGSG